MTPPTHPPASSPAPSFCSHQQPLPPHRGTVSWFFSPPGQSTAGATHTRYCFTLRCKENTCRPFLRAPVSTPVPPHPRLHMCSRKEESLSAWHCPTHSDVRPPVLCKPPGNAVLMYSSNWLSLRQWRPPWASCSSVTPQFQWGHVFIGVPLKSWGYSDTKTNWVDGKGKNWSYSWDV